MLVHLILFLMLQRTHYGVKEYSFSFSQIQVNDLDNVMMQFLLMNKLQVKGRQIWDT